jgi:hypothetical protein
MSRGERNVTGPLTADELATWLGMPRSFDRPAPANYNWRAHAERAAQAAQAEQSKQSKRIHTRRAIAGVALITLAILAFCAWHGYMGAAVPDLVCPHA